MTDGLIHIEFAAGDVIDRSGVYFLDTATGRGEGWIHPEYAQGMLLLAEITDDNRYLSARFRGDEHGYLVDRKADTMWQWDASRFRLLLADERGFLFSEHLDGPDSTGADAVRVIWAGTDMRPVHTYTLSGRAADIRAALLSPDGARAALLFRNGEIARLDLTTGGADTLAAFELDTRSWPALQRAGDLLQVTITTSTLGEELPWWHERVLRLDWDGNVVADIVPPGNRATFSPDGRWITWEEWPVDALAPVTVVADAQTLEPRLRGFGVTTCFPTMSSGGSRWLSDSSGLVVDTSDGYRLLTLEGELRELPAFSGQDWRGEPQPAPDDPDLFALGRIAVSDGAATRQMGIELEGFVTPYHLDPWGSDSTELRFVLPPKPGGGACGERPPMEAVVQVPAGPMPEFPLVVDGVDGCLPLFPGAAGKEEACLPNGTRLTTHRIRPDVSAVSWYMQTWHLWVKTKHGQVGEISLEGNPLRWALD